MTKDEIQTLVSETIKAVLKAGDLAIVPKSVLRDASGAIDVVPICNDAIIETLADLIRDPEVRQGRRNC
jgi:hypothetical protein